jgi:hypothetical protein
MTIESSPPSSTWNLLGVACRPTLLFIAAYALNMIPHEAAHAAVAYILGFSSTLFQLWINPDAVQASPEQQAFIAVAGPLFSLAVGAVCLLPYQKLKHRPSGLMFLMLGTIGIYTFLRNLFAASMGGDFNIALTALGAPRVPRFVASGAGLILLPLFMFFVGRELLGWAPPDFGRVKAVAYARVAPWMIGTLLVTVLYLPLRPFSSGQIWLVLYFGCSLSWGAAFGVLPNASSPTKFRTPPASLVIFHRTRSEYMSRQTGARLGRNKTHLIHLPAEPQGRARRSMVMASFTSLTSRVAFGTSHFRPLRTPFLLALW